MKTKKYAVNVVLVIIVAALTGVSGCAKRAVEKPSAEAPPEANHALALGELKVKISSAKNEFKNLSPDTCAQEKDTCDLIQSSYELASAYAQQNNFKDSFKAYSQAYALMLELKTKNPNPNDSDNDGVPNDRDKCPDKAELLNGFLDEDGCPEEVRYFVINTSDAEGNYLLPQMELDPPTYLILSQEKPYIGIIGITIPGKYKLTLTEKGYQPYETVLVIPNDQERTMVKATLQRAK